jgi:3-oxoadipate enol-lactonase
MPIAEAAEALLHYELSGNEQGEVLVLVNSLGSNLHMWDNVAHYLERSFRVVRFDTRGHGGSSVPLGPYSIEQLGREVLFLLDILGMDRVNVCGLSLGGMVAMWLGIHAPGRVLRLVMANTGARIGTPEMWEQRIATVQRSGMEELPETTLTRWFTPAYRKNHSDEMERIRTMIASTHHAGYSACCGVLRDSDLSAEISQIAAPCLVITGTHDPATPPNVGLALHEALRNSKYLELDASHLSAWEQAAEFGAVVVAFLQGTEVGNG